MTVLNRKHGMRSKMAVLHKTRAMWAIKSIVALQAEFWYNIEGLYIKILCSKNNESLETYGGSTIVYKLLYF